MGDNNNTSFIQQLGQQVGQQATGGLLQMGMGILMEKRNDKRQIRQQRKLNELQLAGNKQMLDWQAAKELEMWEKTGYGAQMEQLKKAGLNPALLYGMSGGGGQTVGGSAGAIGGAQAPMGGGEVMAGMGMGLQAGLMQAQIKVMESQANLNNTEAEKKGGVDTQEAETRINALLVGMNTEQAKQAMMKVETWLKQMEGQVQGATMEERIEYIEYLTKRAKTELENAENTTFINKTTREEKISIIRTEAIAATLRNALTRATTANTLQDTKNKQQQVVESKSNVEVNEAQIKKIAQDINNSIIELKQAGLKIDATAIELKLKQYGLLLETARPGIGKAVSEMVADLIQKLGTAN